MTVIEDLRRLEERILARIQELEANVAELEQLREIAARLGIIEAGPLERPPAPRVATATSRPPRVQHVRASGTAARPGGARSATRGVVSSATGATRRDRVLELVGGTPGISVREVVAQLGVNRTSLYPVVRQLVSDGLLYKDGRGLWPVAS